MPKKYYKNQIQKMKKQAIAFLTVMTILAYHQFQNVEQNGENNQIHPKLCVKSLDINFQDLFKQWKIIFHKSYKSQIEEAYRFKIFIQNCKMIYHHNANKDLVGYTYTFGLNQFSDLNKQQYETRLNTYPQRNYVKTKKKLQSSVGITLQCSGTITTSPDPKEQIDWTKKAVTPVLDQGQCGSSYAISAIGAIEGLYSLRVGKLQVFSVQQILDCSGSYGNQGCFGGFMDQAYWYIIDNGLATSKSYPSKNDTLKCTYTKAMKATSFSKCADVPTGNYQKLQSAVIQQPTAVAIDAKQLQHYQSGIYNGNCSNSTINQAMLVVGYGIQNNQTYWKIKNSLGTKWGMSGYLLLQRTQLNGTGKCGIQLVASIPQGLV